MFKSESIYKAILEKLEGEYPDIDLHYLNYGGSHLYGVNTPNSDTDIIGIFQPHQKDLILGRAREHIEFSFNSTSFLKKDEIEIKIWSVKKLFEKARIGDINALDILYSRSNDRALFISPKWEAISDLLIQEGLLLSKQDSFKGAIGYLKKQFRTYSFKSVHLFILRELAALSEEAASNNGQTKIRDLVEGWIEKIYQKVEDSHYKDILATEKIDIRDKLRTLVVKHIDPKSQVEHKEDMIKILDLKYYPLSMYVKVFRDAMRTWVKKYGNRSNVATDLEGVDKKAISHVIRLKSQIEQMHLEGEIIYPLKNAGEILRYKLGDFDYSQYIQETSQWLDSYDRDIVSKSILKDSLDTERLDDILYAFLIKK